MGLATPRSRVIKPLSSELHTCLDLEANEKVVLFVQEFSNLILLLGQLADIDVAVESLKLHLRSAAIDCTPGSAIHPDTVPAVFVPRIFSHGLGCLRIDFDFEIAVYLPIVGLH